MTDILGTIEDTASNLLSPKDPSAVDRPQIERAVALAADVISKMYDTRVDEGDLAMITKKLQERFDIRMSIGTMFSAEDYRPWLDDARGDIDWYYWGRYERLLIKNRLPPLVKQSMDDITDQILDHLENPKKEGTWARKGLVVGDVQSGKTANYIGLISKAADSGYRVIIVLSGMLNSLRNQTQERIDSGFIGADSSMILREVAPDERLTGVGLINWDRLPVSLTTSRQDFKEGTANQISMALDALNVPLVLAVKKHKGTLDNLIRWLTTNNPHNLKNHQMLLVDDEADLASINTSADPTKITAINERIRGLLHLFSRSSYVGYTATPFANVFIDPETDNQMLGDDLFPRDFILSLDPPDNYVGPTKVFADVGQLDIVRIIDENENWLPPRHHKETRLKNLPSSLKDAIRSFVLSRAIRLLRGQTSSHNSMMINVSRFTGVQTNVKLLVTDYLDALRNAIINHSGLPQDEALKNSEMDCLKQLWASEFGEAGSQWKDVQGVLGDAVSPIGVIEVNSSSAAQPLDYSKRNYPNGRNVIAVGGLNLSRGLTLEGLTTSYFLRNSVMYDTLLQMGRWFGYRDGYQDLCRIYMTDESASWYGHIAGVVDELREEFRRMKLADMTPKDFGLCVRSHPDSLIVTARNKMKTGKRVLRQVNLEGRLVETAVLLRTEAAVHNNLSALREMVVDAQHHGQKSPPSFASNCLWKNVPSDYVLRFVNSFQNHPASQITEKGPIGEYIKHLRNRGKNEWDVALVSLDPGRESLIRREVAPGFMVTAQVRRQVVENPKNGITLFKHRVASRGLEKEGLDNEQIREAESSMAAERNIPDRIYRNVDGRSPLLMLHLLDCQVKRNESLFENGIAAYGISLPGLAIGRKPKDLVEYWVNTVWWKNEYEALLDEDEEQEDE